MKKASKKTENQNPFASVNETSATGSKSEILATIETHSKKTGEAIGVKEIALALGCSDAKVRKSLQKIRKTSFTGYEEKVNKQTLKSLDGKKSLSFLNGHDQQKERGVLYFIGGTK